MGLITHIGARALTISSELGGMFLFFFRVLFGLFSPPYKLFPSIHETRVIGIGSLAIIVFTGFFTGMVLGLQGYHTLKHFGADGALGLMVGSSLVSELGPVLTSLLVAGQAGSALCAQIGIMRVSEQLDALDCMGIDPFNYLMAPKFVAALLSFPVLASFFVSSGLVGGYIAGVVVLGSGAGEYMEGIEQAVDFYSLRMFIVKSLFFALLVVVICSYKGFYVHRLKAKGAVAVSQATTQAVVLSSVCILLWDYLITSALIR